jgi:hypothetical protein
MELQKEDVALLSLARELTVTNVYAGASPTEHCYDAHYF